MPIIQKVTCTCDLCLSTTVELTCGYAAPVDWLELELWEMGEQPKTTYICPFCLTKLIKALLLKK